MQEDEGVVVSGVLSDEVAFGGKSVLAGQEAGLVVAGEGHDHPAVVVEQPPGEGVADRAELTSDPFADGDLQFPRFDVGRVRAGP